MDITNTRLLEREFYSNSVMGTLSVYDVNLFNYFFESYFIFNSIYFNVFALIHIKINKNYNKLFLQLLLHMFVAEIT